MQQHKSREFENYEYEYFTSSSALRGGDDGLGGEARKSSQEEEVEYRKTFPM